MFAWDGRSTGDAPGAPLHVPRARQGSGRHDAPDLYGAWYCSLHAISAVAESIHWLRGNMLQDHDFARTEGRVLALATFLAGEEVVLADLDDPHELARRDWRPSSLATSNRRVTQGRARTVFSDGLAGLGWWSTLEASWTNVTLFQERVRPHVRLVGRPEPLATSSAAVQEAARRLGIPIETPKTSRSGRLGQGPKN